MAGEDDAEVTLDPAGVRDGALWRGSVVCGSGG